MIPKLNNQLVSEKLFFQGRKFTQVQLRASLNEMREAFGEPVKPPNEIDSRRHSYGIETQYGPAIVFQYKHTLEEDIWLIRSYIELAAVMTDTFVTARLGR